MKAVDDLDRLRKLIGGDVPDPSRTVAEHDPTSCLAEAAAPSLPPDALSEGRTLGSSIRCRGALQGRGIADRSLIAEGSAFLIERFRTPDGTELDRAALRRSVRLRTATARQFLST